MKWYFFQCRAIQAVLTAGTAGNPTNAHASLGSPAIGVNIVSKQFNISNRGHCTMVQV